MVFLVLVGTLLVVGCSENTSMTNQTVEEKQEVANAQEKNEAIEWNGKGLALVKQDKYSEALECYDKAIALDPNLAIAWNDKGLILKALGRNIEAQECFDKAKELGYKE